MISQNGYPVLETNRTSGSTPRLRKGIVPGTARHLYVRDGSVAMLLLHFALWFHEELEPLDEERVWDDWGWAVRPVRGQSTGYSNHASGTAVDLNATQHPRGVSNTYTDAQELQLRRRAAKYKGCLRLGEFYFSTVDGMHVEIDKPMADVQRMADLCVKTERGERVLKANPGLLQIINS